MYEREQTRDEKLTLRCAKFFLFAIGARVLLPFVIDDFPTWAGHGLIAAAFGAWLVALHIAAKPVPKTPGYGERKDDDAK